MEFDKNIAIGLKFYTGPIDIQDMKSKEFIDNIGFRFKLPDEVQDKVIDNTGLFNGKNKMTCKFFDDQEGIMYVHFDTPIQTDDLYMFDDEELIYKKVAD